MADKLEDLLTGRIKLPTGGPNAKIGPTPEPSKGRWLLEAVTGYPADPLAEMTPLNGIQMLASGLGIAGGLGKWAKVLKGTGSAAKGEIAQDLYGLNPTQTRRQFLDRVTGKPRQRILQDGKAGFNKEHKILEDNFGPGYVNDDTGEWTLRNFDYGGDHPEVIVRNTIESANPKWLKPYDAIAEQNALRFFSKFMVPNQPSQIMQMIKKRFSR